MARVIKVADISATTTSTVVVPTGVLPVVPGHRRADYFIETSAVGSGSGWTPTLKYASPGAVATTIGTFAVITAAGTKAMTWVYAATAATSMDAPLVNQLNIALTTAGTTATLTGAVYIITDGP